MAITPAQHAPSPSSPSGVEPVLPAAPQTPSARKIALLLCLYFAQGMPYGFQVTALPLYLRARGVSLTAIGFLGVLSLPWMGKAFWAPLVDRYYSPRFGRRRSWIVPMQLGLTASCAVAAVVPPDRGLFLLLGLVFLMNLFAATQDIAVDGLAVDLLGDRELGPGNAAQVVGYKFGMLTSGGLLVWATGAIGWKGLFAGMALLTGAVLLLALIYREPELSAANALPTERRRLKDVLAAVVASLRLPGAGWLLAFVATYKIGEMMVDVMFKPFLVDAGFPLPSIGLWLGTYGMIFSLTGSVVGGLIATRIPLLRAVGFTAAARVLPLVGVWLLTRAHPPSEAAVIAVNCAEHFFAGAVTTAMFAFMMSRVDRRIGATHYTLLASVEVLGKSFGAWPSGLIAQHSGYSGVFAVAVLLSLAYLALLLPSVSRSRYEATASPGRSPT